MLMIKSLKTHITSIFTIATLVIWVILYCGCSAIKKTDKEEVKKIYLTFNMPVVKLTGEIIDVHDSMCIYYYKDYILYQLPNHYSLQDGEKIVLQEIRYNYFAYKKNDKYGYKFASLQDSTGEKILVDSLLAEKAFLNFPFYNKTNDSLVETVENVNNTFLLEKYVPKVKHDISYCDTSFLYYDGSIKNIDYSFSKELDSIMGLKLFKVKLLYNEKYLHAYKMIAPKREFRFEINELPVDNAQEIIFFWERVKKWRVQNGDKF
jgi:hypothetical protein